MANIFDNLLGKNNDAKKLQKEIEGMELKKQSLISAVQNEIRSAQQKIDYEFQQIGLKIYTNYKDKEQINFNQTEHFGEIDDLSNLIAEKEAKMNDIVRRYDDEIGMLRTHLSTLMPHVSNQVQQNVLSGNAQAVCANCKKPYALGVDLFCMGCGQKLN